MKFFAEALSSPESNSEVFPRTFYNNEILILPPAICSVSRNTVPQIGDSKPLFPWRRRLLLFHPVYPSLAEIVPAACLTNWVRVLKVSGVKRKDGPPIVKPAITSLYSSKIGAARAVTPRSTSPTVMAMPCVRI
ncbi:hypothetical protein CEB3_c23650 [Peptococcaceae bacterium CEB3]|nr:hypothetical protein CEB3_c23650 [Peptococcaceae bacterium CEB3]